MEMATKLPLSVEIHELASVCGAIARSGRPSPGERDARAQLPPHPSHKESASDQH